MSTPALASRRSLLRMSGVFMLVAVAAAYAIALRSGHWPPSHPWSGVTLTVLGLQYLAGARADHPWRQVQLGGAVLGLCGAALWLAATVSSAP